MHAFDLPEHIVEALLARRLVLFAGAGISTEGVGVFPESFHDSIAGELGMAASALPFPDLMSKFCDQPNGRAELLSRIKQRLDYGHLFPEVYHVATRFHREVATVPFLEEIFTTNWDDFFERECNATPVVTPEDFIFSDLPGRKVFKLHGSLGNIGSIVATKEDYENCYERLRDGVIGSKLKLALATKTLLFVGYSLSDSDFQRIWHLVQKDMGDLIPTAYIVATGGDATGEHARPQLCSITTDATYFVRQLKRVLVERGIMLDDEVWDAVHIARIKADGEHQKLHERFRISRYPSVIYCAAYQDGLIHALGYILGASRGGRFTHPCDLEAFIERYEDTRREKVRGRKYADVAYVDGFIKGLYFPLLERRGRKYLPFYYVYGHPGDIKTIRHFAKVLPHAQSFHNSAVIRAERMVKGFKGSPEGIVFHHPAWL